jgi:hypothetical protein
MSLVIQKGTSLRADAMQRLKKNHAAVLGSTIERFKPNEIFEIHFYRPGSRRISFGVKISAIVEL